MAALTNIGDAQAKIDVFASKWQVKLFEYCKGSNQKLACWFLWERYLLGLRSLRHLCAVNDLCGCYTIARCCLEYSVAITAIAKHPKLGDDYMGYDVHAKNRHLNNMKLTEETWKVDELQKYMASRFGPDFARKKNPNWHGGFPELCKLAGQEDQLATYTVLCQFMHGTITGMYALNMLGMIGEHETGDTMIQLLFIHTLGYLQLTREVIEVLCPLWTKAKADCERDLTKLAESIVL